MPLCERTEISTLDPVRFGSLPLAWPGPPFQLTRIRRARKINHLRKCVFRGGINKLFPVGRPGAIYFFSFSCREGGSKKERKKGFFLAHLHFTFAL